MKVVIDIHGADKGPSEVIKGCIEALADSKAVMVLVGDEQIIKTELQKYSYDKNRIEIIPATEEITNNDSPTNAIREKKDSSLVKALKVTKEDDEVAGLVSAGSTGAVLTGCILLLGRIKGILRPTLAPLIPNALGGKFTVVDTGANMDCKPEYLTQFAIMGSHYMRAMYGIANPKVALVSVGAEDKKGNELTKEAFQMLQALPEGTINFMGNMEARYCMSGDYDVLVCDGFAGNVLVKTLEGTAMFVMKALKEEIMASTKAKIGYKFFMKNAMGNLKSRMDYSSVGGAAVLGVQKAVVKSHGSSKSATIRASINQVIKMGELKIVEKIKQSLSETALKAETKTTPENE